MPELWTVSDDPPATVAVWDSQRSDRDARELNCRGVPMRVRQIKRAFTLVEILVVVVILGITAAIVVPQIGTQSDLKAAAAAREIMADLIYAQNRSIATQTKHYVVFNTTAGSQSYRIKMGSALVDIPQPVTKETYYEVKIGRASCREKM